jgi:predicted Zn-dependent protease
MRRAWHTLRRVALLSALLPACASLQAIDRGLHSSTETVTERDRITGQRTLSFQNRSQQIEQGNRFVEQFIAQAKASGKRLDGDYNPLAYQRIRRIFSRLHQVSHLRDEQWTPVLIEDKAWNAFTSGGTYFVINSGLEEDLKDDSELANVIAHEMAHTVANHVFEQQSYMQLGALSRSQSARRRTFQAAFTHENEAEADRIAVLYCALAGYDPYAGGRIWRRMHQRSGDDALFVHDHPMNSERATAADRVASLALKYYARDQVNPQSASILASNEVFSQRTLPQLEPGQGGGLLGVLDAAATTMTQRQQATAEEQRQQARGQFMQSVHQVSTIIASGPVGANRWRVIVRYGGNRPLTNLSFKLSVQRIGAGPLEITTHFGGVLNPNTTFHVDFESPELNAYGTHAQGVMFAYDSARAL